jgi:hypothetical protein
MQQVMRYKKVSGGEGCSDIMAVRPDGRWIKAQDYDALAATVIEQQAEIERLREILRTVFARHRAQIDEPLYTAIVMEIDQ